MVRKYLLPLLAVIGMVFAIRTVIAGNRPVPAALPIAPPAQWDLHVLKTQFETNSEPGVIAKPLL